MQNRTAIRAAQIWAKIDQSGGPDACWPWTGHTDGDGYGLAYINGPRWRVHRWVLTQQVGPLASHEVARHSCDNPPCCNPAHLSRGTHADNAADKFCRGRGLSGDRHWTASEPGRFRGELNQAVKLTEHDVRTLRRRHAAGETQTALASEYGISQGHLSNIIRCIKWSHVKE